MVILAQSPGLSSVQTKIGPKILSLPKRLSAQLVRINKQVGDALNWNTLDVELLGPGDGKKTHLALRIFQLPHRSVTAERPLIPCILINQSPAGRQDWGLAN